MKQYCHYHPISPAIWHCTSCAKHYDKLCMPDGDEKRQTANCPHCRKPMTFLSKRMEMPPFWDVKERFFKLPFKSDALLLIVLSSLCAAVMHLNPVFSVLIGAALSLLIVNYGLIIARHSVKTNRSHRQISNTGESIPGVASALDFRQFKDSLSISILLWLAFAPSIILLYYANSLVAITFGLISLFCLPSLMLMLMQNDKRSTSPSPSWVSIIKKMQLSYLGLVAYFGLAFISTLMFVDLLKSVIPSWALFSVSTLVISYLLIALFSMLSYVLIRYESFSSSLPSKASEKGPDTSPDNSPERFDADLDIAIKDGNYQRALDLLNESLKKKPSDLRVHQLYTLLMERKDFQSLEQRSHLILELLLGRGQKLAAYELTDLLRREREHFLVHKADLSLELAEAFHDMKEYKLVLWLAHDAHKRFDPCPELAKLYLLSAKTILSKSQTPEKARGFLAYITQHFAETDFAQSAERLLQHIDQHSRPSAQ